MESATPDASSSAPGASSGKIIEICHWHTGIVMTRYNISSVRLFGVLKTSQKVVVGTVTVMRPLKVAAIARISDSEAIQSRAAPVPRIGSVWREYDESRMLSIFELLLEFGWC